ncbi:DUF805 domain-containing protein [Aliamphritea ceti]|uniref:DUF805 domain-containing protein n=1 Tax=Aliamphritea ceti TaxID=1524258 RepID=UPI0021C299CD|nr:DUF805 domain-containing protein [Aliamphritea ceti]
MNHFFGALKKYADFSGRARRQEYWMFILFYIIFTIVIGLVDNLLGIPGILSGIFALALLLPSLAIGARRLHDTNRSGWWLLMYLLPVVGPVVILIFNILEGDQNENRFGSDPKAA